MQGLFATQFHTDGPWPSQTRRVAVLWLLSQRAIFILRAAPRLLTAGGMLLQQKTAAGTSCRTAKQAPAPAVPRPCSCATPSTSRASVVCHAETPDAPIIKGPISINKPAADPVTAASQGTKPVDRSKGLWTRCDKCGVILYIKHLKEHDHICFGCGFHLKMSSAERIEHMIDPGTWRSLDETLSPGDPLDFVDLKGYPDRIKEAQDKTGLQDGVRTGTGLLHGIPVALGVMDFNYMGGSMGSVVGEKLTRLIEYATQEGLTLLIVCSSGGARMQEGIFSLMQMAKISGALHVHQNEAKLLYITILASPTTGGVTASFGMLGDVIIAEPQAIIGFAGRRVIEQTLNEQLPDDFQTAEYLLDKGLLDLVVPRSFMKGALFEIIDFYKNAPFKKQGRVPFGVQHGLYLSTEEKVRRKWREWSGQSNGAAHSKAASPSYQELVSSVRALLTEGESLDVTELAKDEQALQEALDLARRGKVEWLAQQSELLAKREQETQYMFRHVQT